MAFYVVGVLIPMVVITLMAFVSFSLSFDDLNSRVFLCTLSATTVTAIHASTRGSRIPCALDLTWFGLSGHVPRPPNCSHTARDRLEASCAWHNATG